MTTSQRRDAVKAFCVGLSERRACELVGIPRATKRHRSTKQDESELRSKIDDLATARRRFGYRRITAMLQRGGDTVNHKRVYRIYTEANLQVRKRTRKKVRVFRKPLEPARRPNERGLWTSCPIALQTAGGLELSTSSTSERVSAWASKLISVFLEHA